MSIPLFATVVGGLVLGWRRRDDARRQPQPATFLSTVSHELRTPLNAMIGWVNLLRTGRLGAADTARALESIDRNLQIERRLIDELLDASRLLGGRAKLRSVPIDLRRPVSDACARIERTARNKGVTLKIDEYPSPVVVRGDHTRLVELVTHLLANAVKFSPPGSVVEVETDVVGEQAYVRVADHGDGINGNDLPDVFEPFRQGDTRTRRTGLGLGLAITRQLVQMHGGTISAHSAGEGRGSIFRVTLPLLSNQSDSPGTTRR